LFVGDEFSGDDNKLLKYAQQAAYGHLVGFLYHYARERYLRAARLLKVESPLFLIVRDKSSFDHRALQDAHDRIAAHYRFTHMDAAQSSLGLDQKTHEETLTQRWTEFFEAETQRLAESDDVNIAILEAVAYQNSEIGMASERRLFEQLKREYGDFSTKLDSL